jgi:biotin operon repressor
MAWTGLGRGAVVHHAQMLQRHGILMSQHDGLHRRLFLVGPRLPPIERAPTPAELRVLDALRARGPLTQAELARELGVTLQAANYHLVRLRREARVEGQGPEGATRWSAAPLTPPDISALPGLAPR